MRDLQPMVGGSAIGIAWVGRKNRHVVGTR
jgi:hypothetical protein